MLPRSVLEKSHSPDLCSSTDDGYHFICNPTAGHENLTELRRFADDVAASQEYERDSAGLPAFDLDGLPAAYEERPFHYSGSCSPSDCGKRRTLVWQLDCWVGESRSSDDTHFIYSLDPIELSRAMLAAASEPLRARCGD